MKVKVRAMNAFSASDADVDMDHILQACQNFSDFSSEERGNAVCRRLVSTNDHFCTILNNCNLF